MLEDLTSSELIYIANLMFIALMVFCGSWILTKFITHFTSKHIQFKITKEVAEQIKKDLNQVGLVDKIKLWKAERKAKKELYKPYDGSKFHEVR